MTQDFYVANAAYVYMRVSGSCYDYGTSYRDWDFRYFKVTADKFRGEDNQTRHDCLLPNPLLSNARDIILRHLALHNPCSWNSVVK